MQDINTLQAGCNLQDVCDWASRNLPTGSVVRGGGSYEIIGNEVVNDDGEGGQEMALSFRIVEDGIVATLDSADEHFFRFPVSADSVANFFEML